MQKTILFVIDGFQIGGATAFMKQHANAVADFGYHVVIIGAKGNIDSPQQEFPFATVVQLPVTEGYGKPWGRWLWFYYTVHAIYDVYRHFPVQLFYSPLVCSFAVGLLHPRTWQIPRVYAFCGDVALEAKSARIERTTRRFLFKNYLRYLLQYFVLATSTRIVTFSEYAKALLLHRFQRVQASKITIIPGYADYAPLKNSMSFHKPIRLLCVSRFEPRKGIGLLLKTMRILEDSGLKYKIKIVGAYAPAHFEYFFQQYESLNLFQHVHFLHKVNNKQLKKLFSETDIFIMPSLDYETFGMITLQALSFGMPVIGTPAGATVEILKIIDKRCLAMSISPEALAIAIRWICNLSVSQRQTLRKRISVVIKSKYSTKAVRPFLESYYLSLLPVI